MQPIIYDVAVSIDGFIAGPDGDITGFSESGPVVDDYLARLETYAFAIMGRATYEFGYRFGLKPGDIPYSSMDCHVFSQTLTLPAGSRVELVREPAVDRARRLKTVSTGPIYLCGGGRLAGSLMEAGLIDILRLKRAPITLGGGVRLFEGGIAETGLQHAETRCYDDGYIYQEFRLPDGGANN
ncbi:dihydrofolate reductase family protein [Altererythrobacter arenosus]|uniref:Dihydrofolate reductase family protein n=1 Tax=Altererythrobacter arenosus TaxID=3032592 RepID=A0ABY8FN72_9SPHN|nr:dihydrofolate reductase family protein [Altererythrobacter sp. CAU 1644]WFL76307.1 dihydrofolate reductase family protein [Altererythrobacter sp. CAU 1644]